MVRLRSEDKVIRLFVLKGYEHLESRNLLGKDGCPTAKKTHIIFNAKLRFQHLETRKLHHTSVWIQRFFFPPKCGRAEKSVRPFQGGKGKGAPSPVMESRAA